MPPDPPAANPSLPSLDRPDTFAAPWEAQIFAMVVKLHERGLFKWDEFAKLLTEEIHAHPVEAYYQCWFEAAIRLVVGKGLVDADALELRARKIDRDRRDDHHHIARTMPITVVPADAGAKGSRTLS